MKNCLLFLLMCGFLFSCKKEGCTDPNALNFDAEAEKSGNCQFSKVILYAGSNRVGGTADIVTKIEVYRLIITEEVLVGTITNLNDENPSPVGCTPTENSIVYEFPSGTSTVKLLTRFYYDNGTDEGGDSYDFAPEKLTECFVQNLTI